MHARTVDAVFRFWHKGCIQTVSFSNRLDRQFKGHNVIRRN